MRQLLLPAAAITAMAAASASALEPRPGARLGTEPAAISAALAENGYATTRYEREDGRIEVHADRGGRRLELEIDPRDGRVVEVEEAH